MSARPPLGVLGLVLLGASSSAVEAKEIVFTGELLSARTGQPHPDVGTLEVEILSRAREPVPPGCHAVPASRGIV